jgi:hypothetical protein
MVFQTVRLACTDCDRQDHDGITREQLLAVKRLWGNVRQVMNDDEACPFREPTRDWYTHLGLCPNCRRA